MTFIRKPQMMCDDLPYLFVTFPYESFSKIWSSSLLNIVDQAILGTLQSCYFFKRTRFVKTSAHLGVETSFRIIYVCLSV